jgi:hypothetical protein
MIKAQFYCLLIAIYLSLNSLEGVICVEFTLYAFAFAMDSRIVNLDYFCPVDYLIVTTCIRSQLLFIINLSLTHILNAYLVSKEQITILCNLLESHYTLHELAFYNIGFHKFHIFLVILCIMLWIENIETRVCLDLAIVSHELLRKINSHILFLVNQLLY